MEIKSKKLNSYPGDTITRIEVHHPDGIVQIAMCVYPCSDKLGRYYKNDINGKTFKTLKEVKKYVRENINIF